MQKDYCCYILESEHPNYKGWTYTGMTNNMKRRLRQHNCEIKGGARYTRNKGPWHLAIQVVGFKTKGQALSFEWTIKHPHKRKSIKHHFIMVSRRKIVGKRNIIEILLCLKPWRNMHLKKRIFIFKKKS